MRILFSTDQIYLHGGIEKVMAQKANYFSNVFGYEVFILTTEQKGNKPCYNLVPEINLVDLGVNYQRDLSYFNKINLAKIPSHFKKWKTKIKELNPDVVIVCNYAFDFYWSPFFIKKIPKIKEYHSSRYFEEIDRLNGSYLKKIKYKLLDLVEKKYSKLVLLNPDEIKYYRSSNSVIIPNPINEVDNKTVNLNAKKVIAAGRIAPVKGFENAILCWKQVAAIEPDWQLYIYGQGEQNYIAKLQKLIDDNNLSKHIIIHPAVENLQEEMLNYSLYLLTSITECFPMVLLEALAIGCPIVSFDCPTGPRNIVTNNSDGFLVENQNVKALANKVLYYIQNSNIKTEFSINAKQNSKRFSNQIVMNKWKTLFENL